ncbi:MAG: peptidylprolyl isomerase [Fidelibacterota bacterium]
MKSRAASSIRLFLALAVVASGQDVIDGIAAVVGDNVVLKSDVAQLLQMTAVELQLRPDEDAQRLEELQKELVQNLINQKLILEIAEVESIAVEEREVNTALDQYVNSFLARLGSEDRLEQMFGKPLRELRREWWPDVQEQLITQKFRDQLLKDVSVTRQEVVAFYDEYRDSLEAVPTLYNVSHILLKVTPGKKSTDQALALVRSLREQILSGADFAELAQQYSDDPGSAQNGGELGFVTRGTLVPEFEAIAFALKPGQTSREVQTEFGYHLIQLIERVGEKINVRHILIAPKVSDADEDSVYAVASAIRDSIASEKQMTQFATKYSQDPTTKTRGGAIGWVDPSTFPLPEIAGLLPTLPPGKVSPPIRASDGYHLVLVHAVKPGGVPTLKTHWTEIQALALARKKSVRFNEWLQEASRSVYVRNYFE